MEEEKEILAADSKIAAKAAPNVLFTPVGLELSPTVEEAKKRLQREKPVSAATFTRTILELYNHRTEYAKGRAARLRLEETGARHPVQAWLDQVQTLFDPARIQVTPPVLHGRLAIIGLSLLEPQLRQQLEHDDILAEIISELKEPLQDILSERGRALYEQSSDELADSVPIHPDDPLQDVARDQLGRAAFAAYLAERIHAIPELSTGAYSIHLYGPWGAGKTTLLNFLCVKLEQANWLTVEFNAWQNQHIHPPWWSLYERTFQRSKTILKPWQLLSEYWWRLTTGRVHYLIGVTILAWLLVLVMSWLPPAEPAEIGKLATMATLAEQLGKVLAFALTVWTIVQASSRSLLFGSARAAQNYTELTSDPMEELTKHFNNLVQHVSREGKRIAIFIDDLDRCQSSYVIELLEGIQTLFRTAPVLFVIAADRRWLNACYEEAYDKLKLLVYEPGKSLGMLFLEKAFQFSTSVPGIPDEFKEDYWQNLIQVTKDKSGHTLEEARKRARAKIANAASEGSLLRMVDSSRNLPYIEQRAIREEAVVRLAAPRVVKRIEHTLKPFAHLLEPNPRAMKRLVNAYSVNRALAILSHVDIDLAQLALWTILSLRWPQLTDYLEEHPEVVESFGEKNVPDIPEELEALFEDTEILNIVKGGPGQIPLTADLVRECARLRG